VLTTIGSLPPFPGSPEDALRKAVDLQRAHGIELLTDGEQRGDMLLYYAGLPGIREERGIPRVVGRIRALEDPSQFAKVRDLETLRVLYPDGRFKVSLTGPSTFLLACTASGAGPAYRGPMDPALHNDLVDALIPIVREIGRRGASVQVDEPILSQGMRDYRPALERLDRLASEVPRARASLHVCGGLVRSKVLAALLGLERIGTLNLAFAGRAEAENRSLLDPRPWEDHGMGLGAGCIDVQVSRPDEVMGPESVAALLEDVARRAGVENVAGVTPDCGLRATPPELVPTILENLRRGFERAFPNV
jgi:methionine synthase II (cobalamin-independent)